METSKIYCALAIIGLILLVVFVFFLPRQDNWSKFKPLTAIAIGAIIIGFIFIDNKLLGYILIGSGLILALFDNLRNKKSI
jgi:hypothetical protein